VPNHEDYEALYADFKVLIQRALVEHIPALKDYHDLVEFHIPHPYSKELSKKNTVLYSNGVWKVVCFVPSLQSFVVGFLNHI
jgi:hypothetical protein